jgi:hypothetical protein
MLNGEKTWLIYINDPSFSVKFVWVDCTKVVSIETGDISLIGVAFRRLKLFSKPVRMWKRMRPK